MAFGFTSADRARETVCGCNQPQTFFSPHAARETRLDIEC
jgi:hypothetical protein